MKYEELPQHIKDKLITFIRTNGTQSDVVSLELKDGTIKPAFYNITNETHMDMLHSDYLKEYDSIGYRAKMDEKYGKREDKIFEKAGKIPASEYNGKVCWNEEYYDCVKSFIEDFHSNFNDYDFTNEDLLTIEEMKYEPSSEYEENLSKLIDKYLPKYIWGTTSYKPKDISLDHIIDKMFGETESWEDFSYEVKGLKEFGDALESFKKQNQDTKYRIEDNTKVILLNK